MVSCNFVPGHKNKMTPLQLATQNYLMFQYVVFSLV